MDLELLQFRSRIIKDIRHFFCDKGYLELDTPALSPTLIPETCLEVFKTEYIPPLASQSNQVRSLYLVPSPEIYIKKIISQHKTDVFQLSKCYRNTESLGRIHSPEFTMLEYYTMNVDYTESMRITEALFEALLPSTPQKAHTDTFAHLRPPFIQITMDDAFSQFAGFPLSKCNNAGDIAKQALRLGINDPKGVDFAGWEMDDLYELILVHEVEPKLNLEKPVFLTDYPDFVPCLAKDKPPMWKERWELYANGMELANCYTEETNPKKVKEYFKKEGTLKQKNARVCHAIDSDYWKIFTDFPPCSGVAMGVDRLIATLAGCSSLKPIMP